MHTNTFSTDLSRSSEESNGVFVGNLSFFCEECHLYDLFLEYGQVQHARIVRNDNNSRSLLFGFVTMSSPHEAAEMARLLNNHLYMGRSLRYARVIPMIS